MLHTPPVSRVQRLLRHYRQVDKHKPLSYADLIERIALLPNLADIYMTAYDPLYNAPSEGPEPIDPKSHSFNQIASLNSIQICALLGWAPYQYSQYLYKSPVGTKKSHRSEASIELQMLLYLYEAKPRPPSFSNLGWSQSQFVAWMYQDLAEEYGYSKETAQDWLRTGVKPNKADLPGRIRVGISRRFTAALDRHTVSFYQWMNNDKVVSQTMALLLAKLLESDRDQAYTRATEPDFKTVRSDFYALANFIKEAREDYSFNEKYPPPESPEFLSLPMRVHAPKDSSAKKLAKAKPKSKT